MPASDKNLPPSSRKLRKARDDGDTAKSQVLTSGCVCFLLLIELWFVDFLLSIGSAFFEEIAGACRDFRTNTMLICAGKAVGLFVKLVGPFLVVSVLAAMAAEAVQVGFKFSVKPLAFDLTRLSFVQGFRRILGFREGSSEDGLPLGLLVEVSKIGVYCATLSCAALLGFMRIYREVLYYDYAAVDEFEGLAGRLSAVVLLPMLTAYLALGAVDLIWNKRRWIKRLRMDVQEFRRELREHEEKPEIKSLRRQLHQELLRHNLLQGVRKAKLLVVNRLRG